MRRESLRKQCCKEPKVWWLSICNSNTAIA